MRKLLMLFLLRLIYQQIRGRVTRTVTPGKWGGVKRKPFGPF